MPQSLMLKKLKLTNSRKTYKTFWNSHTHTHTHTHTHRCPFHHRGRKCKNRNSRDTRSNRQVWPWSIKWSRAKANRIWSREHTGHSKYPFSTMQAMTLHMDITKWSIPKSDWLYSLQPNMENLYTVSKNKTWRWLWPRLWAPCCKIQA